MKLFYRELGEGVPLVILHGVFGSSDNWLTVSKSLAEKNKVYLLDQRNHGRSPHSAEFTYSSMAEDLMEFLSDQKLDTINLLGHSMGGKVAMYFAIKYPEKVKNLIVADIAPKYYPPHHERILEGLKAIDLQKIPNRQSADDILSEHIKELPVRQFLLKNLYREGETFNWRINLKIIDKEIQNIGETFSLENRFQKPTLFVRGGKSNYILDEDFTTIKEIFPKSEIKTIPTAGHWIQAEAPEQFLGLVQNFLDANS